MAQKTIPQLQEIESIDGEAVFPLDTGTESWKIKAENLAKSLRALIAVPGTQTSNFNITSANNGAVIPFNTTAGAINIQLPNPTTVVGMSWTLKDIAGYVRENPATLVRFGSEKIEWLQSNYILDADFGSWKLYCNGTDFYFV